MLNLSTLRVRLLAPRAESVLRSLETTIKQLEAAMEKHDEENQRYAAAARKASAKAAAAMSEADRAHRVSKKLRDLLS